MIIEYVFVAGLTSMIYPGIGLGQAHRTPNRLALPTGVCIENYGDREGFATIEQLPDKILVHYGPNIRPCNPALTS